MKYAVIMAGGGGTRLWPAARRDHPKQLQRLVFERPLIAETVRRMATRYPLDHILIVTAQRYREAIKGAVPDLPDENILCEPFGRNTAAALALAALHIHRRDPDGEFAALPADHVILHPEALFEALEFAHVLCRHHQVVDIGIAPDHAETGYGYIELGPQIAERGSQRAYEVRRFVEKPNRATAEGYLASGRYIWNSGMFVWQASRFLDALREHLPDTYSSLAPAVDSSEPEDLVRAYERIRDISVDYAIMERAGDVVAVPADAGWRDLGDWAALYDMMQHDGDGNVIRGDVVALDTHHSLLMGQDRLIAAIGLDDIVVVDTPDALLVMPRHRAQDVKAVLAELRARGSEERL